jgi:hypothetical protein
MTAAASLTCLQRAVVVHIHTFMRAITIGRGVFCSTLRRAAAAISAALLAARDFAAARCHLLLGEVLVLSNALLLLLVRCGMIAASAAKPVCKAADAGCVCRKVGTAATSLTM